VGHQITRPTSFSCTTGEIESGGVVSQSEVGENEMTCREDTKDVIPIGRNPGPNPLQHATAEKEENDQSLSIVPFLCIRARLEIQSTFQHQF
jgi:hypothetical protein